LNRKKLRKFNQEKNIQFDRKAQANDNFNFLEEIEINRNNSNRNISYHSRTQDAICQEKASPIPII
jgi:hypothetical protein